MDTLLHRPGIHTIPDDQQKNTARLLLLRCSTLCILAAYELKAAEYTFFRGTTLASSRSAPTVCFPLF